MTHPESSSFDVAVRAFDTVHAADPRSIDVSGESVPFAVRYHAFVVRWVLSLRPDASIALRLAAHAQHLGRYEVPRSSFPEGVSGYKRWRSTLARKHADDAGVILRGAGFDDALVKEVADLLMKKRLSTDPESAILEDAVCLTFLELELAPFVAKTAPDKVTDVLRKTWKKMSPVGRDAAIALLPSLPPELRTVVENALR